MCGVQYLRPEARVDVQKPHVLEGMVHCVPASRHQEKGAWLSVDDACSVPVPSRGLQEEGGNVGGWWVGL